MFKIQTIAGLESGFESLKHCIEYARKMYFFKGYNEYEHITIYKTDSPFVVMEMDVKNDIVKYYDDETFKNEFVEYFK